VILGIRERARTPPRIDQPVLALTTGIGKTYLAAALAVARVSGTYAQTLARISKIDVLVLDDLLLTPMKDGERRDLLEVLEDRYDRCSTVITSQLPTKSWHEALGDPTIADAICDRLVHNAHALALRGPSMRKKKGLSTTEPDVNH
jgi:DNA replication protein DnaC